MTAPLARRRRPMFGIARLVALCAALAGAPAAAATVTTFTVPAGPYAGSQAREVKLYLPDGLPQPAPLLVALHGCRQTHDDVLRDWGLAALADRHRFALALPFITRYDGLRTRNCWGYWLDQHRHEGGGEPEDLLRIARAVEARVSIDPARRYIVGLSSGGAMSVVAATAHNEYWAAAASAAGLPYGEDAAAVSFAGCPGSASFHPAERVAADMRAELDDAYPIPLLVLQNEADCTVLGTAGRRLRDAHLLAFGGPAHDTPERARRGASACMPVFGGDAFGCEHVRYGVAGSDRSLVETVLYRGPLITPDATDTDHGHYWIGGEHGRDGPWAVRAGPSYPDIAWDFFARHPRVAAGGGPPPDPPPCRAIDASPFAHVAAGRAVAGGWWFGRALSGGDRVDIGAAWDWWSSVPLYEGAAARWYASRAAACGG